MSFAWEDQRQDCYCIFHKMSSVLYSKYSTVVSKYSMVILISLWTLQLILPWKNNKLVKAPFTRDVRKIQHSGWGLVANTALGFASCCICHSTPPLVLYFSYITRNGALTYTYSTPREQVHSTHWSNRVPRKIFCEAQRVTHV